MKFFVVVLFPVILYRWEAGETCLRSPHSEICDWHRLEVIQLEFKARHRISFWKLEGYVSVLVLHRLFGGFFYMQIRCSHTQGFVIGTAWNSSSWNSRLVIVRPILVTFARWIRPSDTVL